MSFNLILILTLALAIGVYLVAPLWLNRNDLKPGKDQNKCMKHVTDLGADPRRTPRPDETIKIIRVTNAGEFVDRCELTNALYELNWDQELPPNAFGVAKKPNAKKLPKLVILYVHGWKHSSAKEDSDLKSFSKLVDNLREKHRDKKHVIGIYLGWDASAKLPGFLENISFWVKKNNADRIAQSGVVTKIVSAIGSIVKNAPGRPDQFIAIGHSFGARLLFSAISQSLVYESERGHPGFPGGEYRLVEAAADAIVLLNPAFEASRYTAIDDITRNEEHFKVSQPPLLFSISTENDWATRVAFPLGQWLGLARSPRELATLGNYQPYFTHVLAPKTASDAEYTGLPHIGEGFEAAGIRLNRLEQDQGRSVVQRHNPFIVASTKKSVVDGHNGIWGTQFTMWLEELIAALEMRRQLTEVAPRSPKAASSARDELSPAE